MEIITEGNKELAIIKYSHECKECGCVFICTQNEVTWCDGDGPYPGYCYAKCPTCGKGVAGKPVDNRKNYLNAIGANMRSKGE